MQTKTNIKAEIVADSINQQGDRLTSLLVTFPRIILAEVNTHRMLSKNTSSSRAIPFKKMVESVQNDPFIPIAWQKHHSGMQGTEYFIDERSISWFKMNHLKARDQAVERATDAFEKGLTKQIVNRYLEPFMWTTMLITGSKEGWDNFFHLRCPQYVTLDNTTYKSWKDLIEDKENKAPKEWIESVKKYNILEKLQCNRGQAEIHIMDLAEKIYDAMTESTPKQLKAGEWHIPFENTFDLKLLAKATEELKIPVLSQRNGELVKVWISTAMAARTSYTVVGDEKGIDYAKMIELHDRLITQDPPHSSPMEHCARAMSDEEYYSSIKTTSYPLHIPRNKEDVEVNGGFVNIELYPQHKQYGKNVDKTMYGWCRNFRGFIQYRHLIETENGNKN